MSSEPDLSGADTRRPRNFRIIAIVIASSLFMEQLDATVLTTALPTMAQSFGVSPLHMSVALTAYLLSLAVFIPASGWVADRYGARTVFCSAIGIFTFGSILCGLANGLTFLVAARLIQGLGGALMVPIARLILLRNVAMKDFISAMSWMLVPALIGPILGPPIGGLIVTYLDWRWIFYVNVPIGVVGIALAIALVTDSKEPPAGRFDFIGLILAGIALSCLTFGVELGARGVLTAAGTALIFGAAVLGAVLYVLHARRLQNANPPQRAHSRYALDADPDLQPVGDRRWPHPHHRWRYAVFAADDDAVGLWHVGGSKWLRHFRQCHRLHADEGCRNAYAASLWLSPDHGLECPGRHRLHRPLCCFPAGLADLEHLPGVAARRLLPVAAIRRL
jgi:hypothetical protein